MTGIFRALVFIGISLLLVSCGGSAIDTSNGGNVTNHDGKLTPTPTPTPTPTKTAETPCQQAQDNLLQDAAAVKSCTMDSDCIQNKNVLYSPSLCWIPLYNKNLNVNAFAQDIQAYEAGCANPTPDCGMQMSYPIHCTNKVCTGGVYFD
jgi:hypothetical protein